MKKVIIAGGSGFLGKALAAHFRAEGNRVLVLTRSPAEEHEFQWDAKTLGDWASELDGSDAIINLTGRTVDCRYTETNRREIMDSRVFSTRVIGQVIGSCKRPPPVWLNSSTATIYRHNFREPWDESGEICATPEAKDEFSVEVARAWEDELNRAETPATRKVALRTAMVLGKGKNSVFPVLRRLVRFGLGGRMGSGKQYVSWIHERDFCRAIEWIMNRNEFAGPVNLCAPNPLANSEMMRTLRQVIGVPLGLPATELMLEIGAFFLRTETELIIKSRRVFPRRLLDSGFEFLYPHFREAVINLHQ